jgi:putative transcriptional regulator
MEAHIRLLEMMARNNVRTIKDLHNMTGLSRTTISQIIGGDKKSLTLRTIGTLCETLHCRIEELIEIRE